MRIQAEILHERAQAVQQGGQSEPPPPNPLYRALRAVIPPRWTGKSNGSEDEVQVGNGNANEPGDEADPISAIDYLTDDTAEPTRTLTYCFLRLANLDNGAFRRLSRYEPTLWRQAVQTMFILRTIWHR